jgi:hypothetical protein
MALIQAARPSSGGGGGGLTITGFANDQFVQNTNFMAGTVNLSLSQTPVSADGITIDYNGQRLQQDVGFTYNSGTNQIEILFGDPYVTSYDAIPYFQVYYPY